MRLTAHLTWIPSSTGYQLRTEYYLDGKRVSVDEFESKLLELTGERVAVQAVT